MNDLPRGLLSRKVLVLYVCEVYNCVHITSTRGIYAIH